MTSCGLLAPEKPLNPRVTFSVGSSFLADVSGLAIRGGIEFESEMKSEAGSYRLFIKGKDSLSFLIEGPLGADLIHLVTIGDSAYLYSSADQGWSNIGPGESASIEEYGISNLSPFLTGALLLPQHFIGFLGDADTQQAYRVNYRGHELIVSRGQNESEFRISDSESHLIACYGRRKDVGDGFYPSQVALSDFNSNWRLQIRIDKLKLNPEIPASTWIHQ
jgi:hypothetical protein